MGMLLLIVGLFWTLMGLTNLFLMPSISSDVAAWTIIINFLLFIFPGLVIAGLGSMIRKRKRAPVSA